MRKIDATNMRRYGRRRSSQLLISQLSYDIKNDRELMEQLYFKDKLSVAEIAAKLNVGHSQLCIHLKDKLGFDLRYSTRQSIAEKEIGSYIESLGFKVEYSVKTILGRKEIDIYVPDKNFAIEYNGLIWHSEISGNKHKSYHLDKTNLCMQAGITLLHIMDFEYKNNPSLVKSRIRAKLGVNNRIFARKTTVVIVDKRVAMKFFSDNHIQGSIGGNIYIGLEYNGRIVAVMSFCKSRYNKKYTWELLRYCSIQDVNVIGGASKLFKHFTRDHTDTIVSYCDLRWNTGNVYAAMGFEKVSNGAPNLWYTLDYSTVHSRIRYQKHKLKDLLCMYDSNLTAWENMQLNGFDRYWDCGSSVWVFNSN